MSGHKKKPAVKAANKMKKNRESLNLASRERKKQKKKRGHVAGSRYQNRTDAQNSNCLLMEKDPRIGSKKPIALVIDAKEEKDLNITKPKTNKIEKSILSPEEELALLENDERLATLLTHLEEGKTLAKEEMAYVDKQLERIDCLLKIVGIELDDEEEDDKSDDIMRLLKGK
ncbi:MAG TPA: Der GTPase-activating protein YihI [Arsenophonus apicola]|uniref:Der GTPase-activating protein YihI n=1 Tax=Arsenophonus apicola TaxID=2879119 RepID=UPI00387A5346